MHLPAKLKNNEAKRLVETKHSQDKSSKIQVTKNSLPKQNLNHSLYKNKIKTKITTSKRFTLCFLLKS